jgi:hypothetical protein
MNTIYFDSDLYIGWDGDIADRVLMQKSSTLGGTGLPMVQTALGKFIPKDEAQGKKFIALFKCLAWHDGIKLPALRALEDAGIELPNL